MKNRKIELTAWISLFITILITFGGLVWHTSRRFTEIEGNQKNITARLSERDLERSEVLLAMGKLTDRVDTALKVLGDHGTEMEGLRADLRSMRESITQLTSDRYRGADARSDQEKLMLLLQAWQDKNAAIHQGLETRLERLEAKY